MLNKNLSYKPLDFGNGLVAGSVNYQGQLVALNTANAELGWATLTGAPPFPNDKWYDQAFVRNYRASLASPDLPGFGFSFTFPGPQPTTDCSFPHPAMPWVNLSYPDGLSLEISSFAPWDENGNPVPVAVQLVEIQLPDNLENPPDLQFSGTISFVRAPYTQLTEGGPMPLTPPAYTLTKVEGVIAIENAGFNQAVALMIGEVNTEGQIAWSWGGFKVDEVNDGQSLQIHLNIPLTKTNTPVRMIAIFGFGPTTQAAGAEVVKASVNPVHRKAATAERWQMLDAVLEKAGLGSPEAVWMVRQGLAYNLACCPVPVSDGATCIITDHQLLPLSWNRDSYWQVQAFLALRKAALDPRLPAEVTDRVTDWVDGIVRRHLIWLFEVAERPDDFWGRAYLTNGRCKDRVFQLDQQCYPFLELADYLAVSGDRSLGERLRPRVNSFLKALLRQKAPQAWLFPTAETAADDKVDLPYNFSSQLTVWQSLTRLFEMKLLDGYSKEEFLKLVADLAGDIYHHFTAEFEGRKLFAYLTDLQGNYRFYHDSNDWPTIFAPAWGFGRQDDQIWLNTLDFAFSSANARGFFPGPLGGLGSVHSPHPWPLGTIQELYLARLFGDENLYNRTWERLKHMACWDGNLPEATYENTGRVASRHWFGWPGAMLCLVLLDPPRAVND